MGAGILRSAPTAATWRSNPMLPTSAPGDTNGRQDVFVHDRQTGQTTRVSVNTAGSQGNDHSMVTSISADGDTSHSIRLPQTSWLVTPTAAKTFSSTTVRQERHGQPRQRRQRRELVQRGKVESAPTGRMPWRSTPRLPTSCRTTPMLPGRSSFTTARPGLTTLLSVDSAGNHGNNVSSVASISGDGRYVAFNSRASNLCPATPTATRTSLSRPPDGANDG